MATQQRLEKITKVQETRRRDIVVVLEDVHDPHNAAAVFRTCEAFGIDNVYLIFNHQQPYDPKQIGKSSSSSANKWLNFHIFSDPKACLNQLRKAGFATFTTALTSNATPIYSTDFSPNQKIALIFGNEHRGVSQDVVENSDKIIEIPMQGFIQSLNISVCAGIVIFEAIRQRLTIRR